jgi:hypothetical protein
LVLVFVAASFVACSSDDGPEQALTGATAPVSADPPQSSKGIVRPPSEPREPLLGDAIAVVDSAFQVVYEFDTGRMRFRGPSPRVTLVPETSPTSERAETVVLAGYPVPVSAGAPQDIASIGSLAVVAGGVDGTAVLLDRSKGDLAVTQTLLLPLRNVTADNGQRASNATAEGEEGKAFVTLVSRLGTKDVLLVTYELLTRTSVGYALDLSKRSLIRGEQLPGGGAAAAVHPYGEGAIAAMSSKKLVLLSRDLRAIREIELPGVPTHLSVRADTAWVSVTEPARLVRVDLRRGRARVVADERRDKLGGPVVTTREGVWWALRERGTIRKFVVNGDKTSRKANLRGCNGISSMVRHKALLFFTCPGPKVVGVIRDGKPTVEYRVPNFPVSAAVLPR